MVLRLPIPRLRWSRSVRLAAVGLTLGISVLGLSLAYIRRRRRCRQREEASREVFTSSALTGPVRFGAGSHRGPGSSRRTGSLSSRASTLRGSSVRSYAGGEANAAAEESELSVEACGLLGVQALRHVIEKLEDALYDFKRFEEQITGLVDGGGGDPVTPLSPDAVSSDQSQTLTLMQDLKNLLQQAYSVKERWKQNVILQTEICDIISDLSRDEDARSSDEDTDSFVSASEYIDLSDLDVLIQQTATQQERYLYSIGLVELEQGNVSCRSIRTQMVGCDTDAEFLAKVHCLRLAFDHIFDDPQRRRWMQDHSRAVVGDLVQQLGGSIDRFNTSFDSMMLFLMTPGARAIASEELAPRGVKRVNFYDIVLDLMFLDSFEQLDKPPSSLLSVINNRWLSNGFKRTALESAVWTILLAKRKMLKRSDGFIAHFYSIAGDISPALAWGFLGPDEDMQVVCHEFKDKLLQAVRSMFSFAHVRYTTVDELADDVFEVQKQLEHSLTSA